MDAGEDIIDDVHGLLEPGVVGGDHGEVGQPGTDLAHLVPAALGPVAAAAEEADDPLRPVGAEVFQQRLQAHGVVGVVDHQGVFPGGLDDLQPALDLDGVQGLENRLLGDAQQTAQGDGGQGVVDGEVAGDIHPDGVVLQALQVIGDPQIAGLVDAPDVDRPEVGSLAHAEGLQLAGVAGHDLLQVVRLSVGQADPALAEELALAGDILPHVGVLPGADVILLQVGEDAVVKGEAGDPIQLHGLGGDLHDHIFVARGHHVGKVLLHQPGLGGGVDGGGVLVAADHLDGADKAGGETGGLQHGADHIGGGGLALGAGDADGGQLLGGVAEPGGGQLRQGQPGVVHLDDGDRLGHLNVQSVLHHQGGGPLLQGGGGVHMSVGDGAGHADKDGAGDDLPGVVDDAGDFLIQIALGEHVVHPGYQIDQIHGEDSFLCGLGEGQGLQKPMPPSRREVAPPKAVTEGVRPAPR